MAPYRERVLLGALDYALDAVSAARAADEGAAMNGGHLYRCEHSGAGLYALPHAMHCCVEVCTLAEYLGVAGPTTILAKRETDFSETPESGSFTTTDLRSYGMVGPVVMVEDAFTVKPVPESIRSATTLTIERNGWRYHGVPFKIEGDVATIYLSRAAMKQEIVPANAGEITRTR